MFFQFSSTLPWVVPEQNAKCLQLSVKKIHKPKHKVPLSNISKQYFEKFWWGGECKGGSAGQGGGRWLDMGPDLFHRIFPYGCTTLIGREKVSLFIPGALCPFPFNLIHLYKHLKIFSLKEQSNEIFIPAFCFFHNSNLYLRHWPMQHLFSFDFG